MEPSMFCSLNRNTMDRLGFKLQWYPKSATSAASNPGAGTSNTARRAPDSDVRTQHHEHVPVPLVVLLPWMFAQPGQVLNKFIALVHDSGWDACVFQSPVIALWTPPLARALAHHLASTLEETLAYGGKRPVVFAAFSGAPKAVYASLLDLLNCGQSITEQVACGAPNSSTRSILLHEAAGSTSPHHSTGSTSPAGTAGKQLQQPTGAPEPLHISAVTPSHSSEDMFPSPTQPLWSHGHSSATAGQPVQADSRPAMTWQQVVDLVLQPDTQPRPLPSSLQPPSGGTGRPQACAFPLLQQCMCGQWFDSGPVDFTSLAGCSMLAPPGSRWLHRVVVGCGGAVMDLLAAEAWDKQRAHMWHSLLGPVSVQQPTLLCFSWDDHIADARRIDGFAKALRLQGADVIVMAWQASEHCAHLRYHKQDYKQVVKDLLAKAQELYGRRTYGRSEGREMTSPCRVTVSRHDAPDAALRADDTRKTLPLQKMLTRSRM